MRGLTLREIQRACSKSTEGPAWAKDFREALSSEDLALTTVRAYCGDLEPLLRWYGPHPVEALTTVDLISYRQHLSEERSMRTTIINCHSAPYGGRV